MANRFISPFFDAGSGVTPEDGLKLFFFSTGTSNPRDTFSDQAGTTPNANPVISDQNGVFDDIYLVGDYKVRLTDKNNVQIWEADPVNSGVLTDAWILFDGTPTRTSNTTFTLTGDQTSTFQVGRRMKFDDSSTLYGIIKASAFATLTTVTVTLDTGALSSSLSAVYVGISTINQEIGAVTVGYNPQLGNTINRSLNGFMNDFFIVTQWVDIADIDGSTDNITAINNAVSDISTAGGGTLIFPATSTSFTITSSITAALKVNLVGSGESTKITCNNCDGINLAALTTGYGKIIINNLQLAGTNGTTRKGIVHTGTETATDELYGVLITGNLITDFNEGISFRTVRNFKIDDNWLERVNSGIVIEGRNIVGRITNNNIVRSSGNGTGNDNGIFLNDHNYTTSGGVVRPEGIIISNNFVGTFKQAINIDDAVFCAVVDNDIAAHIQGISFSTVSGTMSIRGNYINMDDDAPGSSLYGIFGEPQNSILGNVVINIDGNAVVGADTTSCAGVQLATPVTANQANVNILNNSFNSLDTNDIVVYSSGNINIKNNQCYSVNTTSILVKSTLAGRGITIDDNYCVGDIRAPFADTQNAQVILGFNTGTFSTLVKGTTIIANPDTSALTTYASLRGAIADSGTTDSSAANKLIESGQNFNTTITIGDAIHNTTDDTSTFVTAIDSDTQLSISDDIMGTTEAYTIYSGNQVPHFSAAGASATGFEIIPVIQSHNVNAVGNVTATATNTGITIDLETTPAVQVEVHWEVVSRQKYS